MSRMSEHYGSDELEVWIRNFQAEVHSFARVSGLGRGGLAQALGYTAPSVVSRALDPDGAVPETFIARMAAQFEEFSGAFREYLAVKAGEQDAGAATPSIPQIDPIEIQIEKKRSEIHQKQREVMGLFSELEELILGAAEEDAG